MSDRPTNEEIERVRRWECAIEGHSFDTIMTTGSDDPAMLVCFRCGKCWTVTPDEATYTPPDRRPTHAA